jgi:hypothetical protein
VEQLLQAEDLHPLLPSLFDHGNMLGDHRVFDFFGRSIVFGIDSLNVSTFYDAWHGKLPRLSMYVVEILIGDCTAGRNAPSSFFLSRAPMIFGISIEIRIEDLIP